MKSSQRLKVGLVFDDSLDRDDGVAQYVKRLGGWLSSQGHSVIYLVGQTNLKAWENGEIYSLAKNLPVKFNGNKLSVPLPASRQKIRRVIDDNNFDVLHVMVPFSPFMAQRIISAAPVSTSIVGTFHIFPAGLSAKLGGRLLRIIYGRSLAKFSKMIAVSTAAELYARQSFGIKSSVIIPNPVDTSAFESSIKNKHGRIVFLGRLVKRKGCAQLIAAFALLAQSNPDAKLIIAGDGPQRQQLEEMVKRLNLSSRIEFLGYIEESKKADLLASAAIACFPSLYGESFGIVLIEAMAAGSGVVLGGNNPGYESVLGPQPKQLVNPRDTAEFAARLKLLLSDKDLAETMHKWQTAVVGQYDIYVVGNQVLEVYKQAIAHNFKKSHNDYNGI